LKGGRGAFFFGSKREKRDARKGGTLGRGIKKGNGNLNQRKGDSTRFTTAGKKRGRYSEGGEAKDNTNNSRKKS